MSKSRKDITCWNYKDMGHFKNQCPKPLQNNGMDEVHLTEDIHGDALLCAVETITESWIMDSGASFHACHQKEVMQNFRHCTGKVKLADNKTLDITRVGNVSVKTTLGTNWILKDVKFIPDLKRMLISVGQLDDEGHRIEFGDGQWKVTKGSMVIARGRKRGTVYMVEVTDSEVNAIEEDQKTSTLS